MIPPKEPTWQGCIWSIVLLAIYFSAMIGFGLLAAIYGS